ncbi:hypothetical protein GCM10026983_35740 [Gracilibacillus alcaliphilus]
MPCLEIVAFCINKKCAEEISLIRKAFKEELEVISGMVNNRASSLDDMIFVYYIDTCLIKRLADLIDGGSNIIKTK